MLTSLLRRAVAARRLTLSAAILAGMVVPTLAGEAPSLRGDVTALRDVLTLGDLVEGAPSKLAATPLFRAPALGQAGTIQVKRILSAAEGLGVAVETGGRMQVAITRAARHLGAPEMEAAIRKVLAKEFGFDPDATGIAFDAPTPTLVVAPDLTGEIKADEVTLDRRSRRVSAVLWLGPSPQERRAQLRVTGVTVELVDVAVAVRGLERGQALKAADIAIERRPRDVVGADALHDGMPVEGRIPRRPFAAGAVVRPADLVRPELVARGDIVTVVYEAKGVSLSLRAKSNDAGALGDTVTVVNPQSKKALQAVVTGPGKVSVNASPPGRLAASAP